MQTNFYQNYFIPQKSEWVRFLVHKAGEYALEEGVFYRRIASVACAITAVAFSFFNTLSYLLQVPFKLPLNIVRCDLISLLLDPIRDLNNCVRSLLFATFGVTYVAWGILMPSTAFPYFAPPAKRDLAKENQLLLNRLTEAQQANLELERNKEELQEILEQKKEVKKQEEEVDEMVLVPNLPGPAPKAQEQPI